MERDTWKWKKMGEFVTASSFYYVLVGGVSFKRLKTPQNRRTRRFINFYYVISTFGIKRCKILCFKKHFYRSLKSSQGRSRVRALRNTVNVWDHMSRVTSQSLEQFGWSACILSWWTISEEQRHRTRSERFEQAGWYFTVKHDKNYKPFLWLMVLELSRRTYILFYNYSKQ